MPDQSTLTDVTDVRAEAEIGSAVEVELVQSHKNVQVLAELGVSKADTFALLELGLVPRSNILRIDRGAKNVLAVFGIGDPTCLRGIKDCVTPRLDVDRESVFIDVGGGCIETPVVPAVKIDEVEEGEDIGRGNERALEINAHGSRGCRGPHTGAHRSRTPSWQEQNSASR